MVIVKKKVGGRLPAGAVEKMNYGPPGKAVLCQVNLLLIIIIMMMMTTMMMIVMIGTFWKGGVLPGDDDADTKDMTISKDTILCDTINIV